MSQPFYTVDTIEPGKSIGFLVKRCGGLMAQLAERRFDAEHVSFTPWIVLATLSRHEHLTPTALSAETGHDMGALTRIVDQLAAEGLVRRERSERDRRVVEIALTPEGRRHLLPGKRVVVELLNRLLEPYSRQEVETLIALLQRMLARLEEAVLPDAPPQPREAASARRGGVSSPPPRRTPARRGQRVRS